MDYKKIINFIKDYSFVFNIALAIYAVQILNRVSTQMDGSYVASPDTVRITTVTADLSATGNFIYFEGKMIKEGHKLRNSFSYDTRFPSEIFDGYITLVKSNSGGKYYLWSSNAQSFNSDLEIQGWFFTDNISSFGGDGNKEFYKILYPIAEKKWPNLN